MTVITRFAPSPTGMLHIGGARTALFNFLYARRHAGHFLLRVEDTDKARSTKEAVDAILDGLSWLGLTPDAPPIFQSERVEHHVACAKELIARGAAFRCYATPEELQARRDAGAAKRAEAKKEGLTATERDGLLAEADALLAPYRSPWRNGGSPPSPDAPFTVRLRAPDNGALTLHDEVQGEVSLKAGDLDDMILLRADGTPTYMLAVVVDDHDMGVTHIIRGDDHLKNAFRQAPVYHAMGWDLPVFAHIPLIHGPDGAKLSKRHGALGAEAYRALGYLPEAMASYLLRLGWSHGDMDMLGLEDAVRLFDLDGIGKAPARLDINKLNAVNAHFIRQADHDRLFQLVRTWLEAEGPLAPDILARVESALPEMKDRGETVPALAEAFAFLCITRPIQLNKKARKSLSGEALDLLAGVRNHLAETTPWASQALKLTLQAVADETGLSMGRIGPPLRAALTGGLAAPDIDRVLEWLGRDEALGRIDDQIHATSSAAGETQV